MIGTPSGTPSLAITGAAVSIRPLVAMPQGQPMAVSRAQQRHRTRQRPHVAGQPVVGLGMRARAAAPAAPGRTRARSRAAAPG